MRRTAINADDSNNQQSLTSSSEQNNPYQKRSLEDYGFSTNSKRRRHLSPQDDNIDLNQTDDTSTPKTMRKKIRNKQKSQSIINSPSLDVSVDGNSMCESPSVRKNSTRQTSSQQLTDLNLPSWERICVNIDQILSNKHAQSGVYAHEVQLVQQELEALLSMSIVRETILKEFSHPPSANSENLRSKIRKHQEAERIYSSKKLSKKSSSNQSLKRQNNSTIVLDRQVTIAPIVGAKIDRIWADLNNFYRKISTNDIGTIENLVEFYRQFNERLEEIQSQFQQSSVEPSTMIEQLNSINYEPFRSLSQTSAVITHYLDRTSLGSFQRKLYEHIGQTSPVYRTPISSPMHGRTLIGPVDNREQINSLRVSPRLHPNEFGQTKFGFFTTGNIKQEEENELSTSVKSKKRNKFVSSPQSTIKFQENLQLVQNYLVDQHFPNAENVKRQLFVETKPNKKRKGSSSLLTTNSIETNNDSIEKKVSSLISLGRESFEITSSALNRARLQSNNEQVWNKLRNIEREIETLIEKLDNNQSITNPTGSIEKNFTSLNQLVNDWQKLEEQFDDQYKLIFDDE